ncbi:MAG TPA: hypothetical protein VF628_02330 [Allosphingosinicella sp.]
MTAAPSQTRIVNKALALLGTVTRITSITDGSPPARLAEALWDETRDEVLADHPWNFALAREALAQSADVAVAGAQWAFAYELPAGWLRWLPWSDDHPDHFAGEQEGRCILSNAAAPIVARGIARVEDIARWSPGFQAAIATKLAAYMATGVTGQSGMIDRMDALYRRALTDAKRQDGLASGRRDRNARFRSSWLDARGGGG